MYNLINTHKHTLWMMEGERTWRLCQRTGDLTACVNMHDIFWIYQQTVVDLLGA